MQVHEITVGDTLTPLGATLTQDGSAVDLTGRSVRFKMINAAGTVIVDYVDGNASIVTAADGTVQYDFQAADVATPGTFFGWFRAYNAAGTEYDTYPRDGRSFRIEISNAA